MLRTSGFKFLLPCLPYHHELDSQTLNQNKPYCQIFCISNREVTNKDTNLSVFVWQF